MIARSFLVIFAALIASMNLAYAGGEAVSRRLRDASEVDAPSFEIAAESSYLFGSLANPNSYEVAAEFITARWRWGVIDHDSWMSGYNQVYFLAMAEPILRGP